MSALASNDSFEQFSDIEIVAKTLYGEARGEGYEGQQAVCNVIFNRASNPGWWGKDPRSVCLKPYQFSCWLDDGPNLPVMLSVTEEDSVYAQCLAIAASAANKTLLDITNGADSYVVTGTVTEWNKNLKPVAIIGHQSFYVTIQATS